MERGLTKDEKKLFDENGFVVRRGLFGADLVDRARREVDGLHERMDAATPPGIHVSWEESLPAGHPRRIRQLMHSEVVCPALEAMLRSEAMLDAIESLIGPDVSLYHSKLLMKAAADGSAIPWHQDYAYWKKDDNRPLMVNCMVALDRAGVDNGCTEFVPGSHRWGLQEHERANTSFGVYLPGHYRAREDAVPVALDPGDACFFSALVIHGSAPNTSGRDRRLNTFAFNVTGNNRSQCREALRGKPLEA